MITAKPSATAATPLQFINCIIARVRRPLRYHMHGIVNPKTKSISGGPEISAIRPGEELDVERLSAYLKDKIEDGANISVHQFPGGHSNLTYLLKTPGREYVLRRGPLGPVAPKAHDMAREYTVLKAVHPFFPPAPKVFLLCEDTSVT